MDIRITSDGAIDLTSGDMEVTTPAEDIAQKLYRALLALPSNIIAGQNALTYTALGTTVKAFLMQFFAADLDIIAANITVDLAHESCQGFPRSDLYKFVCSVCDQTLDRLLPADR